MKIDNSKIFLQGEFTDVTLTVPGQTTYKTGTVLGRNSDEKLVAFSTENNSEDFNTTPLYILAQDVINEESSPEDIPMVRAFEYGIVNKNKLIFKNTADATNANVLDELKQNGFKLENIQDLSVDTCLQK